LISTNFPAHENSLATENHVYNNNGEMNSSGIEPSPSNSNIASFTKKSALGWKERKQQWENSRDPQVKEGHKAQEAKAKEARQK
jgi:hypothetical protein